MGEEETTVSPLNKEENKPIKDKQTKGAWQGMRLRVPAKVKFTDQGDGARDRKHAKQRARQAREQRNTSQEHLRAVRETETAV